MKRVAIIDDWGGLASGTAAWEKLTGRVDAQAFRDTLADEEALARRLEPFEIVVGVRERTRFTAGLLNRLPKLELIALGLISGRMRSSSGHSTTIFWPMNFSIGSRFSALASSTSAMALPPAPARAVRPMRCT